MELEYRWLALKSGVLQNLDPSEVTATVASAILFDYEAVLEQSITQKTG